MRGYAQPYTRPVGVSWLLVIYLVAGGIIAATHHYWSNLNSLKAVVSAILATLLWPLLLVGVNLHIHYRRRRRARRAEGTLGPCKAGSS
jgi:nitric oxide reductase large subunit